MSQFGSSPQSRFGIVTATLQGPGGQRTFYVEDTPASRKVMEEVFSGNAYPKLPLAFDVRTIIDVGANAGAAAVYLADVYPQAKVWAFEPCPESFALLQRNTQGLGRVQAFNYGLFDDTVQMPLYLGANDSATNSLGVNRFENLEQSVLVPLRDAGGVFRELGLEQIDILKLDVEGAELRVLHSLGAWLPRIGVLYVEFHSDQARREIDALFCQTHLLSWARSSMPHRGTLMYVRRDLYPADSVYHRLEIRL